MPHKPAKRPVRARSGLRPAPGKSDKLDVPGEERSKAPAKGRDARNAHDKDGNAGAQSTLADRNRRTSE